MKRIAAAVAAATLVLAAGGPSLAASAPAPAPPQTAAEAAAVQQWISSIAIWGQGYDAVTTRRTETLGWLLSSTDALVEKLDAGNKNGARAWVETWAVQARARVKSELDGYQALSATPPAPPRGIPISGIDRQRVQMMQLVPDRTGAMMISTGQAAESYIELMVAAASGRDEDRARLGFGVYGLMIAQLEAEITLMQGLLGPAEDTSHHWRLAIIESDRAMILWLKHSRAVLFEEEPETEATAAGLRAHAAQMRIAAAECTRLSILRMQEIRRRPDLAQSDLGRMLLEVHVSVQRSAEVEQRLANAFDATAEALLKGDQAAAEALGDRVDALVTERVEIDTARRRMMAESGG